MHPVFIWCCLTAEEMENILALLTGDKADAAYRGQQAIVKAQNELIKKLEMFKQEQVQSKASLQ